AQPFRIDARSFTSSKSRRSRASRTIASTAPTARWASGAVWWIAMRAVGVVVAVLGIVVLLKVSAPARCRGSHLLDGRARRAVTDLRAPAAPRGRRPDGAGPAARRRPRWPRWPR